MGIESITKLHVTGISEDLVFGAIYDDHHASLSAPEEICFRREDWEVSEDMLIAVEYEDKSVARDGLPPELTGIESIQVISEELDPAVLLSNDESECNDE